MLALEDPNSSARQQIERQIELAMDEDGAEAIVLGCAGMADLTRALSDRYGLPVIDGVCAATKMVEALVSLKLSSSRRCGYAKPVSKQYQGEFARYAFPMDSA